MQLRDLASKMGIAPESLSRAINGNPQLSTLQGIADALGVSLAELFGAAKSNFFCALQLNGESHLFTREEDMPTIIDLLQQ